MTMSNALQYLVHVQNFHSNNTGSNTSTNNELIDPLEQEKLKNIYEYTDF